VAEKKYNGSNVSVGITEFISMVGIHLERIITDLKLMSFIVIIIEKN